MRNTLLYIGQTFRLLFRSGGAYTGLILCVILACAGFYFSGSTGEGHVLLLRVKTTLYLIVIWVYLNALWHALHLVGRDFADGHFNMDDVSARGRYSHIFGRACGVFLYALLVLFTGMTVLFLCVYGSDGASFFSRPFETPVMPQRTVSEQTVQRLADEQLVYMADRSESAVAELKRTLRNDLLYDQCVSLPDSTIPTVWTYDFDARMAHEPMSFFVRATAQNPDYKIHARWVIVRGDGSEIAAIDTAFTVNEKVSLTVPALRDFALEPTASLQLKFYNYSELVVEFPPEFGPVLKIENGSFFSSALQFFSFNALALLTLCVTCVACASCLSFGVGVFTMLTLFFAGIFADFVRETLHMFAETSPLNGFVDFLLRCGSVFAPPPLIEAFADARAWTAGDWFLCIDRAAVLGMVMLLLLLLRTKELDRYGRRDT